VNEGGNTTRQGRCGGAGQEGETSIARLRISVTESKSVEARRGRSRRERHDGLLGGGGNPFRKKSCVLGTNAGRKRG